MPWGALALAGVLSMWGVGGLVAWSLALVAGRGRGALVALPLAFVAGVAGGLAVPALGGHGWGAYFISLATAMAAGAAVATGVAMGRAPRKSATAD